MKKMTENSYLDALVAEGKQVNCYLHSGTKLTGVLDGHDVETLFLRSIGKGGGVQMMCYKINISSVSPVTSSPARRTDSQEVSDFLSDLVDRDALLQLSR
jgi:sRNA-binding regulator protein Hfq